jgi:hypothetical protein
MAPLIEKASLRSDYFEEHRSALLLTILAVADRGDLRFTCRRITYVTAWATTLKTWHVEAPSLWTYMPATGAVYVQIPREANR